MKKIRFLLFLLLNVSSSSVFATNWPIFIAPDMSFLLQHDHIETKNCPVGEGKLLANVMINIKQFLCKNFCPGIWNWISASDEKCHPLATDFLFNGYDIFNYYNKNGTSNFSVITASYGKINTRETNFKFVFTSLPGDFWQCYELNPQRHSLSCANDI